MSHAHDGKAVSVSRRKSTNRGCLTIVFLLFLAMGFATFYFFCLQPVFQSVLAHNWKPTPCTIVSSEVKTHRGDDSDTADLLSAIHHKETALCVEAERSFLSELDGSCRTPIAGLARLESGRLLFRGQILTPDGSEAHETAREGVSGDGPDMGRDAARELLGRAGPDFFSDAQ